MMKPGFSGELSIQPQGFRIFSSKHFDRKHIAELIYLRLLMASCPYYRTLDGEIVGLESPSPEVVEAARGRAAGGFPGGLPIWLVAHAGVSKTTFMKHWVIIGRFFAVDCHGAIRPLDQQFILSGVVIESPGGVPFGKGEYAAKGLDDGILG